MGVNDLLAVARHYWDLGFTSFGGPGVHVVILRKRFVEKLKWVDERTFVDLFALGNALPGPGSTQLAFSIATVTHGVFAGLLGFLLWSLPGAFGMAGLGFGVARIPDKLPGIVLALLTGLNAAAVGLIALAAVQLAHSSATDRLTLVLLWLSASFGICYHAPWMYPTLIAAGGIVTLVWDFRRTWWRAMRPKPQAQVQEVELSENVAVPVARAEDPPAPVNGSANGSADNVSSHSNGHAHNPTTPAETASASHTHSRTSLHHPASSDSEEPVHSRGLNVVSPPVAIALLLAFVLFLTVPLATRAGLKNAGHRVPIGLDVSI